jgi:pulcherriminic acid synthase
MSVPPSEKSLPTLLSAEVAEDPYAFYRRLRDDHPVHYDASIGSHLVSRYDDVGKGYRDPALTTKNYEWQLEPVFGRGLLQMDGREHARKRALVSPHFRGKGAAKWDGYIARNCARLVDGIVERVTDSLVEGWRPGRQVDVCRDFANHLPIAVIADVLGLPRADQDRFFGWYTAMIGFLSNLSKDPVVAEAGVRAKREFDEYIIPVIQERRMRPGPDLISAMCTVEVDGDVLDNLEVRTHVTQLLVAGAETTDKTIGNLLCHLLSDREQFLAVRDDRSLVLNAVAETLRFTPPSQMNARVTDAPVTIGGTDIDAGATVTLIIASANRDERRFARPDTFDIFRADLDATRAFSGGADHFAFGSGRHFCLGAILAKAELEVGLNMLLDRFPDMRLADGFTPTPRGIKMRAVPELQVAL